MVRKQYETGRIAYDIGQQPAEPVLITDGSVGSVTDQDNRDLILNNTTNNACGVDRSTTCVDVIYIGLSAAGDTEYTMPVTRLAVPQATIDAPNDTQLSQLQYNQFLMLTELMREALMTDVDGALSFVVELAQNAGIDDAVISAARVDASSVITDTDTEPTPRA
jgi:hypothetical protein